MDSAAIAVRFALYLDLMLAFGLATFALTAGKAAGVLPLRLLLILTGVAGLAASVIGLALLASRMAGTSLAEVDRDTLTLVLTGTAAGTAWIVRMAALAILATVSVLPLRRGRAALAAASGAAALGTLAWSGHGAMDEGGIGWVHLCADVAHLLAAGVWIGALFAFVMLVFRPADRMDPAHLKLSRAALHGFSGTGTLVVAVIVASGLVNSWLLVGPAGVAAMPRTLYGRLLLAKLAAFVLMLVLASVNRFRLTPSLAQGMASGDHSVTISALRRSLALETASGAGILALVAWLGTLEPIAST